MQTRITARHFKATPELRDSVEKIVSKLERYYDGITDLHVVLIEDESPAAEKRAEITLSVYRQTLTAREAAPTFKEAVQQCTEQLRRQILRYKAKRRDKGKTSRESARYTYSET